MVFHSILENSINKEVNSLINQNVWHNSILQKWWKKNIDCRKIVISRSCDPFCHVGSVLEASVLVCPLVVCSAQVVYTHVVHVARRSDAVTHRVDDSELLYDSWAERETRWCDSSQRLTVWSRTFLFTTSPTIPTAPPTTTTTHTSSSALASLNSFLLFCFSVHLAFIPQM